MSLFLLRLLPVISAILAFGLVYWQWLHPLIYPQPLVWFFVWYIFATLALVWKRLSWKDALEKLVPSVIALCCVGLGFLMVESGYGRVFLTMFFVGIPYMVLELLFLLLYAPARYPVNGLSRFNIALVPISTVLFGSAFQGLIVGLRAPWWMVMGAFVFFGVAFFFFTAHPTAHHTHRLRWGVLGGWAGLHVAILELVLPLSVFTQGALAALLIFVPLRLRRYAYGPQPSHRVAWSEAVLAGICFFTILWTARWI